MKLNVKAAAVSVALFWGAVMFLMALAMGRRASI